MKRFWTRVDVVQNGDGWTIELDGRPVKTPARSLLLVPALPLIEAIAAEWRSVSGTIDPRAMPLTGLANAAIDRVESDSRAFAAALAKYAEADLSCYRAEGPSALTQRQAQSWDPLLAWARQRYDVDFATTSGLMHIAQPEATIERLACALETLSAFKLAGLSPLVTIGGSLLAALAVLERAMTGQEAWDAVSVDDRWQLEQWGSDDEAERALEQRRRDFLAAARFLQLLES